MKEFGPRSNGAKKKDGGGYLNFMKKLIIKDRGYSYKEIESQSLK